MQALHTRLPPRHERNCSQRRTICIDSADKDNVLEEHVKRGVCHGGHTQGQALIPLLVHNQSNHQQQAWAEHRTPYGDGTYAPQLDRITRGRRNKGFVNRCYTLHTLVQRICACKKELLLLSVPMAVPLVVFTI